MNEDFQELSKLFISEYRAFESSVRSKNFNEMLRGLATLASIAGTMRAIREYAQEEIEKSGDVEKADTVIMLKVIPAIESNR